MSRPQGPRQHVKFDGKKDKPQAPKKPEFKLSERPKESGSKLWVVLGLLAVVGLAVYAARSWVERPDPHYVIARDLVGSYESGRAPTERNYNNTIYDRALDELDLVDPESISAEPARELRNDILHGREAFLARRQSETRDKGTILTKRQERIQANLEEYQRVAANPVVEYPECDEGPGHKH